VLYTLAVTTDAPPAPAELNGHAPSQLTRVAARVLGRPLRPVADGVWLLVGGIPQRLMNVYLILHEGRVTVFDAGVEGMALPIRVAAARLGAIDRVVLSHAHVDHRGAAPRIGAPVWCPPREVADAEGDGGLHYMDFSRFDTQGRFVIPRMARLWDGGPVRIDGTIEEGETVAGFEVVATPGHSPGQIMLWRESDRLALSSDTFYVIDSQSGWGGPPRVPHVAYNYDHQQAKESLRKLAAMRPAAAWPGHGKPVIGDVQAKLEEAAATT
jgi:hydroxyacylglutathione hydrolase